MNALGSGTWAQPFPRTGGVERRRAEFYMWMGQHKGVWHARGLERSSACRKMLLHRSVADLPRFGCKMSDRHHLPFESTSSFDPTMQIESAAQVQLILVVIRPPSGVRFAVQSGRDGLLQPYSSGVEFLSFAITMTLGPSRADGSVLAGQAEFRWERRAKIKLAGIPGSLVETAAGDPNCAIEARILGTARDRGPVCASVHPPAITWDLALRPLQA